MLFVMFRAFNCVLEARSISACMNTVWCAMCISLYLVTFVMVKILIASMPEKLKRSHAVSWAKLAKIKGIRKRHGMEGFLSVLTTLCAMFLFCLMGSDSVTSASTVQSVGLVGGASVSLLLISVLLTRLSSHGDEEEDEEEEKADVIVEELANTWVGLSYLFTLTYSAVYAAYGVGVDGGQKWEYMMLLFPITLLSYVICFFAKPLRNDRKYKFVVTSQFALLGIVSEIFAAVGNFRNGLIVDCVLNLVQPPFYALQFKVGMKVRGGEERSDEH